MALNVVHPFVSAIADGPATGVVRPANWNAAHTVTGNLPVSQLNSGTNASLTTYWRGDGAWVAPTPYIFPADYGVVADGSTDDTAALNAMFAALAGTNAIVMWPKTGFCKTTDTVTIGSFGSGPGGPQTHVSIMGGGTTESCGISYVGTSDREILRFSKCTNFFVQDFRIQNMSAGQPGTSTGFSLGGNGSGSGNQTSNFMFVRVAVFNCNIGILAGVNSGAASEGIFDHVGFGQCNTGFIANDFNSVNFNFNMCTCGGCGVAFDTGVSGGYNVFGGSSTLNTTVFKVQPNASCEIIEWRSEGDTTFVVGAGGGGQLVMQNCSALDTPSPFVSIQGAFLSLTLNDCFVDGSINITNFPQYIRMKGNLLQHWDTTHALPLFIAVNNFPNLRTYLNLSDNHERNSAFPGAIIPDFIGSVGSRFDGVSDKVFYETVFTQIPVDLRSSPSLGSPYLALSHVRQLAEGTIPGATGNTAPTPGKNLRVSGKFATSNSFSFLFKRAGITVTPSGGPLLTATAGSFYPTDVGKPIHITAGMFSGADFDGYITDYLTSTTVNTFPCFNNGFADGTAGKAAVVGADEPDAKYIVAGLAGNANETFWVDTLAATGFTLHSSNASSTATVVALIVR